MEKIDLYQKTCNIFKNVDQDKLNKLKILILNNTLSVETIDEYVNKSNSIDQLMYNLAQHSNISFVRNLFLPKDFLYAPISYDSCHSIILNYNNKYNAYYLSIRFYQMFVADIDSSSLEEIENRLTSSIWKNDRFAIHQTSEGKYHIILLSRPLLYCSKESIILRTYIKCDLHYNQISLYCGNYIRLISKDEPYDYKLIKMIGSGQVDCDVNKQYQLLLNNINQYHNYNHHSFLNDSIFRNTLYNRWLNTVKQHERDMGLLQYYESCPAFLIKEDNEIIFHIINKYYNYNFDKTDLHRIVTKKNIRDCDNLEYVKQLWDYASRRQNYYQIFEENRDYAIGIDLSVVMYFIVFRDLLIIDYDDKMRLSILSRFCRLNPEYKFCIVNSRAGWHCFCISHRIEYNSKQAEYLLIRLRSDPLHYLSSFKKGYSIRLNRKLNEKECKLKCFYIGKGNIIEEQMSLVNMYLNLFQKYKIFDSVRSNLFNANDLV